MITTTGWAEPGVRKPLAKRSRWSLPTKNQICAQSSARSAGACRVSRSLISTIEVDQKARLKYRGPSESQQSGHVVRRSGCAGTIVHAVPASSLGHVPATGIPGIPRPDIPTLDTPTPDKGRFELRTLARGVTRAVVEAHAGDTNRRALPKSKKSISYSVAHRVKCELAQRSPPTREVSRKARVRLQGPSNAGVQVPQRKRARSRRKRRTKVALGGSSGPKKK